MKKIYLLPALLLTLLASCTLSMEDWVETEEEKGYEEVETVENQVFKVDYEYKETTRSLTEEILKYVATVEEDSIIWFTDNIPAEWLPKQGGCVVANCCEQFPMGLVGKVLSVERENGMYRVVTTEASLEEAFNEFDFDFDADLFTTPADSVEGGAYDEGTGDGEEYDYDPDSEETDESGEASQAPRRGHRMQQRFMRRAANGEKEQVIRDWAMFNAINNGTIQKRGESVTRASLSDIYDKDIDNDDTKETDIQLFKLALDGELGKAFMKEFSNGLVNTAILNIYSTTKTTLHKVVQLKKKREYTSETTTSGIKVGLMVGKDLAKDKTDDAKKKTAEKLEQWMRDGRFKKYAHNFNVETQEFTVEIPLPSVPFGIIVRIKPVIDFNVGIYGNMDITFWLSKKRTITDIVDGRKIKDETKKLDTPSNKYAISAFGKFNIYGGLELFIGLGKKVGKNAAGIGGFIQGTINLDLNLNKTFIGDSQLGSANEFLSITGKAKVGAKVLTAGLFGDIELIAKEFTWWDGVTFTYYPRVSYDSNFPLTDGQDEKGMYDLQTIRWKFSSLGMHTSGVWNIIHQPILAIFKGGSKTYKDQSPADILTPQSFKMGKQIKRNQTYTFVYKNYDYGKEYWIVPGVIDGAGRITYYTDYEKNVQPTRMPNIEYDLFYDEDDKIYDYFYQTEGTQKAVNFKYSFQLPFRLRNAGVIDEYWDDWGLYYEVLSEKRGFRKPVTMSLKNSITRSGKYVISHSFYINVDAFKENLYVENACIYYKLKGVTTIFKLNNVDEKAYTYKVYTITKEKGADYKMRRSIKVKADEYFMDWGFDSEGYKEIKDNKYTDL